MCIGRVLQSGFAQGALQKTFVTACRVVVGVSLLVSAPGVSADIVADINNQACDAGFGISDSPNLVQNGDFATPHGGSAAAGEVIAGSFSGSINYAGDDIYAPDTSMSIQTGAANYFSGIVQQEPFPGDPDNDIPPIETYLYSNGNNTGGQYKPWIQQLEVEASTSYTYVAYFSNMIAVGESYDSHALVSMMVDDEAIGEIVEIGDETIEQGETWVRVSRVFTTRDDQTSLILSIADDAASVGGDDLATTAVGLFKCALEPTEPASGTPPPPVAACANCDLISGLDGHAGGGSAGLILLTLLLVLIAWRIWLITSERKNMPLLVIYCLSYSAAVSADNSPVDRDFSQRFYLGASAGVSRIEPVSPSGRYSVSDNQDIAAGIHVGYDISKRIAVEGHYADLGEAEIFSEAANVPAGGYSYAHTGISAIGYLFNAQAASNYENGFDDEGLYRREGFSVFGRVGVSKLKNDFGSEFTQDNDAQLHLGGGVEYGWANGFAVRAEYLSYDRDSQTLTLGLVKRFGKASPYQSHEEPAVEEFAVIETGPVITATPFDLPTIMFDFDSIILNKEAQRQLQGFIEAFSANPTAFSLVGHTDSRGSKAYNQTLSLKRAQSVSDYLTMNGLIEIDISIAGMGEDQPIAANATEAGRALNRRVEFELSE